VSKKPARTWQQPSDVSPVDATRFEAARDTDGVMKTCPRCRQPRRFGEPCPRCEVARG
jgi:hypothetical protein